MKKLFIVTVSLLITIVTLLFFTLNSTYLFDKILKSIAPKYNISYKSISGNVIDGISVEDIRYKENSLIKTLKIKINTYALLRGSITVSKFHIKDLNTTAIEKLANDFASTNSTKDTGKNSQGLPTIPLILEIRDVYISLLPFKYQTFDIKKEILSIELIRYTPILGIRIKGLKEIADTNIGRLKIEGGYNNQDIELNSVELADINIDTIMLLSKSTKTKDTSNSNQNSNNPYQNLLPKSLVIDSIKAYILPYRYKKLYAKEILVDGKELNIDLKSKKIISGIIVLDLLTNLGRAKFNISEDSGNLRVKELSVTDVYVSTILNMLKKNSSDTGNNTAKEIKTETNTTNTKIPFLPPKLGIDSIKIELKPDMVEGIKYTQAKLNLKDILIDFKDKSITGRLFQTKLDSNIAKVDMEASLNKDTLNINNINISNIDTDAIMKLLDKNSSKTQSNATKGDEKRVKNSYTLPPFAPHNISVKSMNIGVKPTKKDIIDIQDLNLFGKNILFDIQKAGFKRGDLNLKIDSNITKASIKAKLKRFGITIPNDGKSKIYIKQSLYDRYNIPLNSKELGLIGVTGNIDKKSATIKLWTRGKNILKNSDKNSSFNIDIKLSQLLIHYKYKNSQFKIANKTELSTPYTPKTVFTATATGSTKDINSIKWYGRVLIPTIKQLPKDIKAFVTPVKIDFKGTAKTILAKLHTPKIDGSFASKDMKKGILKIYTPKYIKLSKYLKKLPKKLKTSKAKIKAVIPIDFKNTKNLQADIKVISNLANIDSTVAYKEGLKLKSKMTLSKNSLLKSYKNINFNAITPLDVDITQTKEKKTDKIYIKVGSRIFKSGISYNIKSGDITGKMNLADTKIDISGNSNKKVYAKLKSKSLQELIKNVSKVYKIKNYPSIEGDLAVNIEIDRENNTTTLKINSKKLVTDTKSSSKPIKDIHLSLGFNGSRGLLLIKNYGATISDIKIFANKESKVAIGKERVDIKEFWINDTLKINGEYNIKKAKGIIYAKSNKFHIEHENANIDVFIDSTTKIDKQKIDSKGKVTILGGKVYYNISKKRYATDDDIIIVQHMKKKQDSFFEKNVQLSYYIDSKKPLLFKQKNVNIKLKPQLSIIKSYLSPLQMTGSIDLLKGGYYKFENKKFVLKKSAIYFTGNPTAPMLNIRLEYKRYGTIIWITVSGLATEPALNFSSSPSMTRDQILSFILFDNKNSSSNSENMLSMVGSGLAKSILGNLGLKVDTLVLSQNGFEIGKKISDKISVIYDQEDESKIIIRIEHSSKVETDISVGQDSQSVDIIYRREF